MPGQPQQSQQTQQTQQSRVAAELAREQSRLDHLYERLGAERAAAEAELAGAMRRPTGSAQARLENEAAVRGLRARVGAFDAAENGLCFGRLDPVGGRSRYLGRTSLRNPDDEGDGDGEPLLIDWRAPAARPFYTATAAAPQGVRLRRHLHTRRRTLVRIDDELLDGSAPDPGGTELVGEAALLGALAAGRSGRMRDVVATLQAEQDRIIRSRPGGVLVVQGGPGTGKTVVALHRAAYLLYTHPQLAGRGVLVIGPDPVFLGYIGQVLPGLGETNVLLATVADLFPGVAAEGADSPEAAGIKGRAAMAGVIAAAVRGCQAAVTGPVTVEVGGELLRLEERFLHRAAETARATGLAHNLARPRFVRQVLDHLAHRLARVIADLEDRIDADLAGRLDTAALDAAVARDLASLGPGAEDAAGGWEQDEIAAAEDHWRHTLPRLPQVRRLLDGLWPALTAQQLLAGLLADPARLRAAAPALTDAERAALHRPAHSPFTAADVPLLDEAAELLGHDGRAERVRQARERAGRVAYAQGVLDIARGSRAGEDDDEDAAQRLGAADLVDAQLLADRYEEPDARTVAERAAAERTWVFGHVIVDEAQELSAMAWRLLVRRCPTRSFTVVGDVAQSGAPGGARSWEEALEPSFGSRWRLEQLSVNYRTPEEIVAAGGPVLAAIGPSLAPPRAVRRSARPPHRLHVPAGQLPARTAQLAATAVGQVAVIAPEYLLPALAAALPGASHGPRVDLERRVVLLSARQSKGLEFDTVLLVDPQGVLSASPRGLSDLYVALTRAAAALTVLHPDAAPPALLAHLPAAT